MFYANELVCELVGADSISSPLEGFFEGEMVEVFVDGRRTFRKVYDCRDGLYVTIRGCKVFYEDFN